jgi:formylglycine-generating enzyme required for sulfatase activity
MTRDEAKLWLERWGLALPSEAQWEAVARAGTSTPWWTGSEEGTLDGAANIADLRLQADGGKRYWHYTPSVNDAYAGPAPVGSFRPNAFGLHDVHGNVWEWCEDLYGSYAAPGVVASADIWAHVARGGSYLNPAWVARSSCRGRFRQGPRDDQIGVRPVRPLVTN